jgi:hypothetical protein
MARSRLRIDIKYTYVFEQNYSADIELNFFKQYDTAALFCNNLIDRKKTTTSSLTTIL